ncbi:hypothetical protein BT93_B1301 [Corymbia citriodora subsp. variegata]|nr:hypothetical protein BT93_B1301 [Corymbia citriodora subsp. variegata]
MNLAKQLVMLVAELLAGLFAFRDELTTIVLV